MFIESYKIVQINRLNLKCEIFSRANHLPLKHLNNMEFCISIKNKRMSFLLEFRKNKMTDKAELKRKYKETEIPMGVYVIKNLINGNIFIGKNKNIQGRINRHKFELEHGFDEIKELQEDYNQHGLQNFSFEILDRLELKEDPAYDYKEDLIVLEELWLEKLQPFGERGYNIK